jgi:hypothetical protein
MGRFNAFLDQTEQRDDDNVRHVAAESPDWLGGAIGRLMQGYGYRPSGFAPLGASPWIDPLLAPQPAPLLQTATTPIGRSSA